MNKNLPPLRTAVEQVIVNTTGWVGHHPHENKDLSKGQTFIASTETDVDNIAVYSNHVSMPGHVVMTVHNYDPQQQSWGPALTSATINVSKTDNEKWIDFHLPSLHLVKGHAYGFRLISHDSYIGVGEAAISSRQPLPVAGQEWQFIDDEQQGNAFSYFSLAFKVGKRAA